MPPTTIPARSDAPCIVTDAYVSERQRFVFVYLPNDDEPRRFRHLDNALECISAEGYIRANLETESFACVLLILQPRADPIRQHIRKRTTLQPKETPTHG